MAASSPVLGVLLIGVAGVAIIGALLAVDSDVETMPDNAVLLYRPESNTYASPPCILAGTTDEVFAHVSRDANGHLIEVQPVLGEAVVIEAREVRQRHATPDPVCLSEGGFLGAGQSPIGRLVGRQVQSRWDADGEWRW